VSSGKLVRAYSLSREKQHFDPYQEDISLSLQNTTSQNTVFSVRASPLSREKQHFAPYQKDISVSLQNTTSQNTVFFNTLFYFHQKDTI
jgi:hypothetical protein